MRSVDIRDGMNEEALVTAVTVLRQDGVMVAPTETVYGLMTRWDNAGGRERIFELKQRPRDKRLQMLAASLEDAYRAGVMPGRRLARIAESFWPGPLTVVCRARDQSTVGLRIPAHAGLLMVLRRLGDVLAATSANRSGKAPLPDGAAAVADLIGCPDLLLDAGRLPPGSGVASTVVDVTGSIPHVLRAGPIALDAIRRAWDSSRDGTR